MEKQEKDFNKIILKLDETLTEAGAMLMSKYEKKILGGVEVLQQARPSLVFAIEEKFKTRGAKWALRKRGVSPTLIDSFIKNPERLTLDSLLKLYKMIISIYK